MPQPPKEDAQWIISLARELEHNAVSIQALQQDIASIRPMEITHLRLEERLKKVEDGLRVWRGIGMALLIMILGGLLTEIYATWQFYKTLHILTPEITEPLRNDKPKQQQR